MIAELLQDATWSGPELDDDAILAACPDELQHYLKQCNGFILFRGGLHVRGACTAPDWHSLREVWKDDHALSELYAEVAPTDVPFAQDCMGDQFLLRKSHVVRLKAEDGGLEELNLSLDGFFAAYLADPEGFLSFSIERPLEPGMVFFAYPPFVVKSEKPPSLGTVPVFDALHAHAALADQLRDLPDGAEIRISVDPPG
ncbi:hypothetical protein [Aeoliella sp.]|uniref:hypothetical protein n=1 Tax=Aeoliella sp. TaxID=2795800 RepID=UPI003CCC03D9